MQESRANSDASRRPAAGEAVSWDWIAKSGREQPDSRIGLYAGEAASYERYFERFLPVILRCHSLTGLPADSACEPVRLAAPERLGASPPARSTRLRLARNIAGFPFPSAMTRLERVEVLRMVSDALRDVPGRIHELGQLTPDRKRRLRRANLLFDNTDRFMASAGILDHWPDGRAVFVTADGHGGVWINEEDHLRVFAIRPGYDLAGPAYAVTDLHDVLSGRLAFAQSPRLGHLTSCPSNLGTGLRASVLMECSRECVRRLQDAGLELRGAAGEGSRPLDSLRTVSNRQRLGVTETDILGRLDASIGRACADIG